MIFLKCFLITTLGLFIFSCSSSSIEQRYGKDSEKKEEQSKSTRFTSDNDERLYKNEFDENPIEYHPVNIRKLVDENKYKLTESQLLTDREKVMMEIVRYLNTPYQYGGNNNVGIDCSAFTQNVFTKSLNYKLPRTARQQYEQGEKILNKNSLKFGDLVFFNTTKNSFPGHVGIIIGEDLFAHASFSKGVTVSSLQSSYFVKRYVGARRQVRINE
ncbi:MAG: C40 family peptidase [Melioribacteraceae bacterium]|jgi:cell wall-associated NlpC family hydrolase|nr:C40 family peptidase [Melioribacteraceae bacterium]